MDTTAIIIIQSTMTNDNFQDARDTRPTCHSSKGCIHPHTERFKRGDKYDNSVREIFWFEWKATYWIRVKSPVVW